MSDFLTPVEDFGHFYAKREDIVGVVANDEQSPCGAKVRQYLAMIDAQSDDCALGVGCGRNSAMQLYVAAIARDLKRKAFIVVPAARERSASTEWCIAQGAHVVEVRPGYPSVYKKRFRDMMPKCVRWNARLAAEDTAAQVANIPEGVKRIVVPTGSGLTAAGVIVGVLRAQRAIDVTCVSVSIMVKDRAKILALCQRLFPELLVEFMCARFRVNVVRHAMKYDKPVRAHLPDGTLLDPYYAAKALKGLYADDCLWIVGRRPLSLC